MVDDNDDDDDVIIFLKLILNWKRSVLEKVPFFHMFNFQLTCC